MNTTQSNPFTHVAFFPQHPEDRVEFSNANWAPVTALVERHPDLGAPKIEEIPAVVEAPVSLPVVPASETEVERAERIGVSDFGGELKHDAAAKERIERQHAALAAGGVDVDAGRQLYATGTRMASVGYEVQAERASAHGQLLPLREAAAQLVDEVLGERRRDVVVTARELARSVEVNGKLRIAGYSMQEQALRGLFSRIESPAAKYVFGLRERIAGRVERARAVAKDDAERSAKVAACLDGNVGDKAKIAEVLAHELSVAGDVELKLRTRSGSDDAFAVVSPDYAPADAPEVVEQILRALPPDARGTWSYDPATTSWELRVQVWTPTPVAEQAVGEPFRGYVSFKSRDNGTGSLKGGGGIEILACLNASTYVAATADASRRHVGKIVADARRMLAASTRAIDALCEAWGTARRQEAVVPADLGPVPLHVALPGFWFGELYARRGELAGVLPGRTKDHVAGLVDAFHAERRDPDRIVKADFAQAWTRYIQGQPEHVRRDAEEAVAAWVVSPRPVRFDADRLGES